jgi:DNA-binding LacI/PurR family transcriptional regulator/biotin operon repressor
VNPLRILSASEQVAAYLRDEIRKGTWRERMPGGDRLARELGVGRNTIDAALLHLERDGLLVPQGTGKRRRIELLEQPAVKPLQVRLLPHADADRHSHALNEILHDLRGAGHAADFAGHSLMGLKMDASRVARLVESTPADAWVVCSGSREVLTTLANGPVPAFALLGRMRGLAIAGVKPDKVSAVRSAVRRLVALGHSRIVMLVLPERVHPVPGAVEQAFLDELRAQGISTGPYNLAVRSGGKADLQERLDAMFRHTPPSAVFLDESEVFIAAQLYLARRGILAPEKVSLVSTDPAPYFDLLDPPVSHITWTFESLHRLLKRWLNQIASGKDERTQSFIQATFAEGGTIGKATAS